MGVPPFTGGAIPVNRRTLGHTRKFAGSRYCSRIGVKIAREVVEIYEKNEYKFRGEHKAKAGTKRPRIKSFGRFLESGRFPKGGALWSPSAEGEIPQPPDRMHKDWTKRTNQRQPSGILNEKAHAHCFMGFAAL